MEIISRPNLLLGKSIFNKNQYKKLKKIIEKINPIYKRKLTRKKSMHLFINNKMHKKIW